MNFSPIRRFLFIILVNFLCFVGSGQVIPDSDEKSVPYGNYSVSEVLNKVEIPRLSFNNEELSEVCNYIQRMLRLYLHQITEKDVFIEIAIEGDVRGKKIDLNIENMSVTNVLKLLEKKYNLATEIKDGRVIVSSVGKK